MSFPHLGTDERPFIIGHRGGAGPALENSILAFRNAAGGGPDRCDGVELDIHLSADGRFVVHHDPQLGSGKWIRQLALEQIQSELLPDGTILPVLEAVLAEIGNLVAFVEVKDLPAEADADLLALVASSPAPEMVRIHSFDHRIVARLRAIQPSLSTGALSCSYPVDPIAAVRQAGADTLWQQAELIDRPLVALCRGAGVGLVAWTVNTTDEANRLRALGVTALCGDWPARLRPQVSNKEKG